MVMVVYKWVFIYTVLLYRCYCQECVLSLHRDLPKKHEPLYFVQNGDSLELLMPHMVGQDGVMTLYEGQQIVLACPGKNNRLTVSGAEATLTKCAGGVMLNIENRQFPTYQLECENPVQAILQVTSHKCGCVDGNEIRIGFQSPSESILSESSLLSFWRLVSFLWSLIKPKSNDEEQKQWINLITTCHNMKRSESIYATHIIYGKTLAGAEMKWIRPQFTQGNDQLYPGFNPDNYYKKKHQRTLFIQLVGKKKTNHYLEDNFLTRGHLAPDADFLFGTWQYMTYYYANSAPQWLSINSGNWQKVERLIRKFVITTASNLLVITGTFDILTLPNYKSKQIDIFLHPEEKRLPVPKYFWKIISNPESKSCVAFVCSNNPYLKRAPKKLCKDISSVSGWPIYPELSKGYTYCCDVNDLRTKITNLPPIECSSLLVGPKAFYNYKDKGKSPAAK